MKHFVREGRLEEEAALVILTEATALLRAEDTMIDVEAPITGLAHIRVYCMFLLAIILLRDILPLLKAFFQ